MRAPLLALSPLALLLTGCVERTIDITSEPSGALVLLNDREVGRTPVQVQFTFYGDYDVRVSLEGYEPLVTKATAKPPIWDNVPLDLFAEMTPADLKVNVPWHFVLLPESGDGLLPRADEFRALTLGTE